MRHRGADTIRAATTADALALACVHVTAWREAYAGILPDALLAKLSIESRTAMWTRILNDPSDFTAVHVAERDGEVIGFGACGSQRTAALKEKGYDGEVSAIYVLRSFQKQGVGAALMQSMALHLSGRGLSGVSLWVLRDNAVARRFYEQIGGEVVGEKEDIREGTALIEVAYGWPDLARLRRLISHG
jgi:ribosomal protein S18 acetylase RimI-like enzyme